MPLFVCATPIGNLDDCSPRLLSTLRAVNLVCAEDTRHTSKLLARYEISVPLTSCHQHTTPAKIAALCARLENGETLALVTDAGTPGVSDPGPLLVREAASRGIEIIPIPGPCAFVAALSISGFDAQRFSFLGFLPRKPGKRKKALQNALARNETLAIYESPFRIEAVLESLSELAPDAPVVLCRELTKQFEETLRGKACHVLNTLSSRKEQRGEFVLIIGGLDKRRDEEDGETSPDIR